MRVERTLQKPHVEQPLGLALARATDIVGHGDVEVAVAGIARGEKVCPVAIGSVAFVPMSMVMVAPIAMVMMLVILGAVLFARPAI